VPGSIVYPYVALQQRALDRSGDRAALAPDRQRHAVLILDHLDHPGIAAEPARGLGADTRVADQPGVDRVGRALTQAAQRDRDHHIDRRAIRSIATQVVLRDREQRIGAVERLLPRIRCPLQHARRACRTCRAPGVYLVARAIVAGSRCLGIAGLMGIAWNRIRVSARAFDADSRCHVIVGPVGIT
jgi:hypothetical protein